MADAPDHIDPDGQGWWHDVAGATLRADPTGSEPYRYVYLWPSAAAGPLRPHEARLLGKALIAAADFAADTEPGGLQHG